MTDTAVAIAETPYADLDEMFGNLFAELHRRGMPLPWLLAIVAINGAVQVWRFTLGENGLDPEELAAHGDCLQPLPLNIMVVDASGEGTRIVIGKDNVATFH